jgi:predicted DNA-binding WGR domain protein
MQRYEMVEGGASKFWEVDLAGTELRVRFGRIGTNGQEKVKAFADAAAAQKEYEKLVREKTGKGYGLVAGATALRAPATTPVRAAPPPPPSPGGGGSVPSEGERVPDLLPPLPGEGWGGGARGTTSVGLLPPLPGEGGGTRGNGADLAYPTGGFQWSRELEAELPVFRGVRAGPPPSFSIDEPLPTGPRPDKLPKALAAFMPAGMAIPNNPALDAMAAALGMSWSTWNKEGWKQHVTRERLRLRHHADWQELVAQAWSSQSRHALLQGDKEAAEPLAQWALRACVVLHGWPFTFEVALPLWQALQGQQHLRYRSAGLLEPLRAWLASSTDADHAEALAAAEQLRTGDADLAQAIAFLFPEQAAWCAEAAEQAPVTDDHPLIHTGLPLEAWLRYLKRQRYVYWGEVRPGLLLQIRLHGDAALAAFPWALERSESKDVTREVVDLLVRLRVPDMPRLLVGAIESAEVRAGLERVAQDHPAAVLKEAIECAVASGNRTLESWTVRQALRLAHALPAALAALPATTRQRFEATLDQLQRTEAEAENLPPVLRTPPWLGSARQQPLPTLQAGVQREALPERITWPAEEVARLQAWKPPQHHRNTAQAGRFPTELQLSAQGTKRLLAGEPLQAGDVQHRDYSQAFPELVLVSPREAQVLLWNSYPTADWALWYDPEPAVQAILAVHGTAALPGFIRLVQAAPDKMLPLVRGIDTPQLVEPLLRAFRQLKKSRELAQQWILACAPTVLAVALPAAFGTGPAAARDDARHAIRFLANQGRREQVRAAAQAIGAEMLAALDALLAQDPLLALPSRMPRLPTFFVPAAFRRPELKTGGVLPASALEHLGTMLAISKTDAPYAGLQQVRDACTPVSLAEFAWDLFEAWLTAGAPSKESWAFTALGLLGDDETARRLAPRIREWPGESAHARAVAGLDLLAAIGSDVALMHLNGIAGKAKFKGLQERAKEKIATVAEARGFTPEELADRLVPDLGLDEQGTAVLDFGPRQFTIGFDETLKPFVRDATGARLKDLPKPTKADDAALAEAATERYKQMKKDAKAVASLQLIRLEMGMVARRRWSGTDFRLFFLEHPLMRHLAARLVWGVYVDGALVRNFRVAEDWTLADAQDAACQLADDATVGISHVLEMSSDSLAAFGQLFADYEVQQPFRQLGRETFALTPEEAAKPTLTRFAHKTVATGSVLGLANRGWERGQAQDAGWVGEFTKRLGDGLEACADLDPGTIVGDLSYEPKQKIPTVTLRKRGTYGTDGLVPFGQLDPILASEVLRDLELLAPVTE